MLICINEPGLGVSQDLSDEAGVIPRRPALALGAGGTHSVRLFGSPSVFLFQFDVRNRGSRPDTRQ